MPRKTPRNPPFDGFATQMSRLSLLACLGLSLCLAGPATARTLSQPSAEDLLFIYSAITKTEPDIDEIAKSLTRYTYASEFDKPKIFEELRADLEAHRKAVADVTEIVIPVGAVFSEYDSQYHEYVFSNLSDSTFITFTPFQNNIGLFKNTVLRTTVALMNGTAFSSWPLTPDQAKAVFERNHHLRNVSLMIDVVLTGGRETTSQEFRLDGQIKSIRVLGDQRQPLGDITPDAAKP
jgi:hypothetical protein